MEFEDREGGSEMREIEDRRQNLTEDIDEEMEDESIKGQSEREDDDQENKWGDIFGESEDENEGKENRNEENKSVEEEFEEYEGEKRINERSAIEDMFGSESEDHMEKEEQEKSERDEEEKEQEERVVERENYSAEEEDEIIGKQEIRVMEAEVSKQQQISTNTQILVMAKLPKGLKVEPKEFVESKWSDAFEKEREEYFKRKGGRKSAKVAKEWGEVAKTAMENTIRWGKRDPQADGSEGVTNTYLVSWSNGTMTLHVGDAEPFLIEGTSLVGGVEPIAKPDAQGAGAMGAAGGAASLAKNAIKESNVFVASHHNQEGLLEVQARINESWVVRANSASQVRVLTTAAGEAGGYYNDGRAGTSNTVLPGLSEEAFAFGGTSEVRKYANKATGGSSGGGGSGGTKLYVPERNPELEAKEIEKMEESREKAMRRIESTKRRQQERILAGLEPPRSSRKSQSQSAYHSDEDEELEVDEYDAAGGSYGLYNRTEQSYKAANRKVQNQSPSGRAGFSSSANAAGRRPAGGAARSQRQNDNYYHDELDDFVVDDDEDVGQDSPDETEDSDFSGEDSSRRHKHKHKHKHDKHQSSSHSNKKHRKAYDSGSSPASSKATAKRRLLLSDDEM